MVGNQDISDLGIPRPANSSVNSDITYSLALLATSRNEKRGRQFIDFLRSPEGQSVYTNGGFTGLTMSAAGRRQMLRQAREWCFCCDGPER